MQTEVYPKKDSYHNKPRHVEKILPDVERNLRAIQTEQGRTEAKRFQQRTEH